MIDVVEALPNTRAGNYIAAQLIRSCHSPTFKYGEAQGAESPKRLCSQDCNSSKRVEGMPNSPKNNSKESYAKVFASDGNILQRD